MITAKVPKKDGKDNPYAERFKHHMPLMEGMQTASRKAFKRALAIRKKAVNRTHVANINDLERITFTGALFFVYNNY